MIAPAVLLVLSGSAAGDVDPLFVRRCLDRELCAARWVGVALKLVHDGEPGVAVEVAGWAAERGVEVRAVTVAEAEFGMIADAVRRDRLIEVAERAEQAGWAARVVIFTGRRAQHSWELLKAARAKGIRTEIHSDDRPDEGDET